TVRPIRSADRAETMALSMDGQLPNVNMSVIRCRSMDTPTERTARPFGGDGGEKLMPRPEACRQEGGAGVAPAVLPASAGLKPQTFVRLIWPSGYSTRGTTYAKKPAAFGEVLNHVPDTGSPARRCAPGADPPVRARHAELQDRPRRRRV